MDQKVFVSSTSVNLEDVRPEIVQALISWDFNPVFFESSSFPIDSDLNVHDSCLDVVKKCDIFILIVDSKYGSLYEGSKYPEMQGISVTRAETRMAIKSGLKIIPFVRDSVWHERTTYNDNPEIQDIIKTRYADNKEIFKFVNEIASMHNGNWISTFRDSVELKEKLERRLFPDSIIQQNKYTTIINLSQKSEYDVETILEEENEERIILEGNKEIPYVTSISSNCPAECLIYADTYNHYLKKSYCLRVRMPFGLKMDELKKIIKAYYHCFSEFSHHVSAFSVNQQTNSWFGYGALNFIKTLEMQDERYAPLKKKNKRIHHREAACFIDETVDSTFYIHLQPNKKRSDEQEITFDYVNIGLLFNNIPCSDVYNKFFKSIGSIPNTIEEINQPPTVHKKIECDVEKDKIIITNPKIDLGGWVCGIVTNNSKTENLTNIYYDKIIVNFNQDHEKEDKCTYKIQGAMITTLPELNFPARIVNYKGKWEFT